MPSLLTRAAEVATKRFLNQRALPPGRTVPGIQFLDLPPKGMGAFKTLDHFEQAYEPLLNHSAGPRYFGFVTGGSTPAAVIADQLVSVYDQNACGSNDSIAPQLEHQTIHFFRQLFGLDNEYYGSFVTGATMANMVGLALARQWAGEHVGIDVSQAGCSSLNMPVVGASPHSSILKAMSMLGIGRNALKLIDTLPAREAIDIAALEDYLSKNTHRPVTVVASAGTVNTVDFDDLQRLATLKKKYTFWLHVDAAFGGFAAASEKFKHLMHGINAADSITIDAHKWLNVPYDAAMQFTRHKNLQLKVFQNSAAYLGDPAQSPDFFHYTPENSRRWRALPSWFTLMAYGREGYAEIVERNCRLAATLGDWIESSEKFKLLAPVRMNVVCFTLKKGDVTTQEIGLLLARIRDDGRAFFTPTAFKGTPAIRAAISNWQTTDADIQETIQALTDLS